MDEVKICDALWVATGHMASLLPMGEISNVSLNMNGDFETRRCV